MLSNFQITDICKKHHIPLQYVGYKDLIPKRKLKSYSAIINMDSSNPNDGNPSGSHWIALIKRDKLCYYFDSFGFPAPKEITNYVIYLQPQHYAYNTTQIQNIDDDHCGYYCIGLLLYVKHNYKKGSNLYEVVNDYTNLFDSNTDNNKRILLDYLAKYGIVSK